MDLPSYRRSAALFLLSVGLSICLMKPVYAAPYSALVVEVESERVLYAHNADELRHPASLTKMMTLYLVFEALAEGRLSLSDRLWTSSFAASRPPSKLALRPGDTIAVEEAILGLVTQSANDAATVIAESLGGSEANFAVMMTQKARQLGMTNTIFHNASGLPDPTQVTTAWDMFRLGKALLKHFPQYYTYFSTERFQFRSRSYHNHNHLLENYPGTDGIKTGFVNASGYNLVASARRNGYRLIGVVFGGATYSQRDAHMRRILDDGFAQLEGREPTLRMAGIGQPELLRSPQDIRLIQGQITERRILDAPPRRPGDQNEFGERRASRQKTSWQVRLGEFYRENEAEQRLTKASKAASYALRHAKAAVAIHKHRGRKVYVAYFKGLSKEDAGLACKELRRKQLACSQALVSG